MKKLTGSRWQLLTQFRCSQVQKRLTVLFKAQGHLPQSTQMGSIKAMAKIVRELTGDNRKLDDRAILIEYLAKVVPQAREAVTTHNLRCKEYALFYSSLEWRRVRYLALVKSQGACECCGRRPEKGHPLHVDHIKPRSLYPTLELDLNNLQVLCEDCNLGKGNMDETDWRDL